MNFFTFSQVNEGAPSATDAGAFSVADGIIFAGILILICIIVWLSNREIKISRSRIHESEKLLESERNALQRRISERTVAYVRAEEQRMIELGRNAEFGKLSQGLFHDLISPLSTVSLYAEQLEKDSNHSENYSAKEKEMIRTVIQSSKRMNSYMESVRRSLGGTPESSVSDDRTSDNNNMDDGSMSKQISNESLNVADLKKEIGIVEDILGYKARMSGVEIVVDRSPKTPIILPVHPVRLHQLILNLVSNAIDACTFSTRDTSISPVNDEKKDCKITISVSVSKKDDKEYLEISVSDTGVGISKENLNRMFKEKFTTKRDGSGIGLIVVKTIVEKDLGGNIRVESEEGKGARFVVRVPYR